MKGLTRDEYNQKIADILKHKRKLKPKKKRLTPTQQVRKSRRKYGKHDKVTTQSSEKTSRITNIKTNIPLPKLRDTYKSLKRES